MRIGSPTFILSGNASFKCHIEMRRLKNIAGGQLHRDFEIDRLRTNLPATAKGKHVVISRDETMMRFVTL